jgi:hypothetical protein
VVFFGEGGVCVKNQVTKFPKIWIGMKIGVGVDENLTIFLIMV